MGTLKRYKITKIDAYIIGEVGFSILVAFLFFFFILFLNNILLYTQTLLAKKAPFFEVMLLMLFTLPAVIALASPFGTLVGVLMAVTRLSSENEMLAFQAVGVPKKRLFTPIIVIGAVLTFGSFLVNDILLPLGTVNFTKLYRSLIFSNPELELAPYSVKNYQDTWIITGDVRNKEISNLLIIDRTEDQKVRLISADSAALKENKDKKGVLSLELDRVSGLMPDNRINGNFEYFSSNQLIYNILFQDIAQGTQPVGPKEMSSLDLARDIAKREVANQRSIEEKQNNESAIRFEGRSGVGEYFDLLTTGNMSQDLLERNLQLVYDKYKAESVRDVRDRTIATYKMELYQKFSIPLACIGFALLAFPMGIFNRRIGRTLGFGIGLLVAALYWAMLLGSRTAIIQFNISPEIAMFLPNLLVMATAGILIWIKRK